MANIHETLQQAIQHHQASDFPAAEKLYRSILVKKPNHPDALNLLGTLFMQQGKLGESKALLQRAVRAAPSNAAAHNNYGLVLQEHGDLVGAIKEFESALKNNPSYLDALNNLGSALREQHEYARANTLFEKLLALDPASPRTMYNYGITQLQAGAPETAAQLLRNALSLHPAYHEARIGLGVALLNLDSFSEAEAAFRAVLAVVPNALPALEGLGDTLMKRGDYAEALTCYEKYRTLAPLPAEKLINLASAYERTQQPEKVEQVLRACIATAPNFVVGFDELGAFLIGAGRLEEALAVCELGLQHHPQSLKLRLNKISALLRLVRLDEADAELQACLHSAPSDADVLFSYAMLRELQQRPREGLDFIDRALLLRPDSGPLHQLRSVLLLVSGSISEGWDEFDYGTQNKNRSLAQRYPYPMWSGQPLAGKTILIYGEQGLGDEILFASCLPDLLAQGARCVVQCDPRLEALFTRSFPPAKVRGAQRTDDVAWLESEEPIDYQTPVGSLPRYVRRRLEDFPQRNAFLVAAPERRQHWRKVLDSHTEELKVGIVWRSKVVDPLRARAYTTLDQWASLLHMPGVTFVNLQYDDCTQELAALPADVRSKIMLPADINLHDDIDDVGALIAELDLVITVGTVVYNLAGAVGTPTWLLRRFEADWVALGTDKIPWYPSVEVFRQLRPRDWSSVYATASQRLSAWVAARKTFN